MLHPIKVPSCAPALQWLVQLQHDILAKLCASTTTKEVVTPEWIAAIRSTCHAWLKDFSQTRHKERELLSVMRTIANAPSSRKQEILSYVEKSLAFGESFDPTVTTPKIPDAFRSLGIDEISVSLHILLEAFYEIALCRKKGLPVNSSGTTGGSFNRDQFVRVFQEENNDQVCPFCDGEMDGAEVDHWLPKSVYPALSCHPENLVPACGRCNRLKGKKLPLASNGSRPFDEWFHPYRRPAYAGFSIQVSNTHEVSLGSSDSQQQVRLNNFGRLINLQQRWSERYQSRKGAYLKQLADKVRRRRIEAKAEDILNTIKEWLAEIEAENTRQPHSIIRRAILERANGAELPDFDGWLKHAEDALS